MRASYLRLSRIAVAMSGGIDSSVTAYLLKQQGHEIIGIYMTNWDKEQDETPHSCSTDTDLEDMRSICKALDIQAHHVNLAKEYWLHVFEPCIYAYKTGYLTPNPDVDCNRHIKFDAFLKYCRAKWNVDFVATGHYARLQDAPNDSRKQLLRAVDTTKDQSYFLATTSAFQFNQVLFPLGHLLKSQVRDVASKCFPNHRVLSKHESMGICFVGRKRFFAEFLGQYLETSVGSFVDVDTWRPLGPHRGKETYTVGQKAKIGGLEDKYYVVARSVEPSDPHVYVARGAGHPTLFSDYLIADLSAFSWIAEKPPVGMPSGCGDCSLRLQFKARYNNQPAACSVSIRCEACSSNPGSTRCSNTVLDMKRPQLVVTFDSPERAVTPGQILVLYNDEEVCLGGGPIAYGGRLPSPP